MPEIPERPNPSYEDMDDVKSPDVGSADTFTEYSFLTEDDQKEWRKEARRRAQRRIRPGFALPAKREDTDDDREPRQPARRARRS